jgi:hypothetical protein
MWNNSSVCPTWRLTQPSYSHEHQHGTSISAKYSCSSSNIHIYQGTQQYAHTPINAHIHQSMRTHDKIYRWHGFKSCHASQKNYFLINWGSLILIWILGTLTLVTHCNSVFMVFNLQASRLSRNGIWWQFLPVIQFCLQWMDFKMKPRLQWITSVIFPGKIKTASPVTTNNTWLIKYTNDE